MSLLTISTDNERLRKSNERLQI
jgi:hypothetical protein